MSHSTQTPKQDSQNGVGPFRKYEKQSEIVETEGLHFPDDFDSKLWKKLADFLIAKENEN